MNEEQTPDEITEITDTQSFEKELIEKNKQDVRRLRNKVQSFFINRVRLTFLVIIFIIAFGIQGLLSMPQEVQPEVKVPFGFVVTSYIGASPQDMEELVTKKLEEEILGLDNLETVSSVSGFGLSSVSVEFEADADLDKSLDDLRRAVDDAKSKLPAAAEDPQVIEVSFDNQPILELSIIADKQLSDLQDYAEDLQTELEKIPNVSSANIIGGIEKEFQINLNAQKMKELGISQDQVSGAIQSSNLNFPIGSLEIDDFNYSLRVENRFDGVQDILDLPVTYIEGSPLFLYEIADIQEVYPDQDIFSYVSVDGKESRLAITLAVVKQTGGSIFDVVNQAKETVEEFKENELPEGSDILILTDFSVYIEDSVNTLVDSGKQTLLLVFVLLLVVLGIKEAFLAGLAIPLSFAFAFGAMNLFGGTINSLTLFSLVLGLGLLIDNAIVIVEGCYFYIKSGHYTPKQSAILAVRDFKYSLLAGTMTTVSAFLPMLLTPGIIGEFIKWIPLTITIVLLGSLFIALTIIPSIASVIIKPYKPQKTTGIKHALIGVKTGVWDGIENVYERIIRVILKFRALRWTTVIVTVLLCAVAIALPVMGFVKAELFPKTDQELFYIQAELPAGSSVEKTERIAREIEQYVRAVPELDNYQMSIGYDSGVGDSSAIGGTSGGGDSNFASFTVNLVDADERERSSIDINEELRGNIKTIQGAIIRLIEQSEGPPSGAPIEIRIFGDNLDDLVTVTSDFKDMLENTDGAVDITSTYRQTAGEFEFSIDPDKAAYFGVTAQQVASTLRTAVSGLTISDILRDGDELDIVMQYKDTQVQSISDFNNITVMSRTGDPVPISNVVDIHVVSGIENIRRQDEERFFTVSGYTEPDALPAVVTEEFVKKAEQYAFPAGISYEIGGETEDIEESFTSLFTSMFLAVFLIALILILEFDSFLQPLIILFAVPMSLIGVIPGLMITGNPISFPAFLGIVGLAGIVVNDAIILIDKMNVNQKRYTSLFEAIVEAAKSRVQPVILTTLTTIFGILPLALSDPFWSPLGTAIMYGIAVATFLTLGIVPIMNYGLQLRIQKKKRKRAEKEKRKEIKRLAAMNAE